MHMRYKKMALMLAVAGAVVCTGSTYSAVAKSKEHGKYRGQVYSITVKNLTYGQIFSPPLAAAHKGNVSIFSAGKPASAGLELLAEDGAPTDRAAELSAAGAKVAINGGDTPAPILPGQSATFKLKAGKYHRYISIVGMLVTTNDAFFGLNGVDPRSSGGTFRAVAYDAGTEVNDEDCNHIPGPPGGNGGNGDNGLDENGVVHVHRGIHLLSDGAGKVDASRDDWRNPVAEITIRRYSKKK